MIKVLIVQRRLTHYRVPFFEKLRNEMRERNLELILAYGDPTISELTKQDSADLSWAARLDTKYYFDGKICWQPFYNLAKSADIIVITHENKLIYNLLVQWFFKNKKVVLWGHGENLQRKKKDIRDDFKYITAKKADWWLAYTDMSVPLIKASKYPEDRITVLNNAVDTSIMDNYLVKINDIEKKQIRDMYGIHSNDVGIFVGSLYPDKKIDFLLKCAEIIKLKIPTFELIIIGNGPDKNVVENYSEKYDWIHYYGAVFGREKINLLSISRFILNPGLVGLGVLDSFLAKKPLITTDCGLHSPEIVYLENMINGIIVADDINIYAETICNLFSNNDLENQLIQGCNEASKKYTIENMVKNFCDGIELCISNDIYRH